MEHTRQVMRRILTEGRHWIDPEGETYTVDQEHETSAEYLLAKYAYPEEYERAPVRSRLLLQKGWIRQWGYNFQFWAWNPRTIRHIQDALMYESEETQVYLDRDEDSMWAEATVGEILNDPQAIRFQA